MHFSVSEEVGWDADDEAGNSNSGPGMKKRYRLTLSISRGSPKNDQGSGKKGVPRSQSPGDRDGSTEHDNNSSPDRHVCYGCGMPRSKAYHAGRPPKHGKIPRPSLCTQCRYDRKVRVFYGARERDGRCRGTKCWTCVDNRQWCANCGTLRSDKYHGLYLSGNLPPWSEICHKCTTDADKQGERVRRRLYAEDLEAAKARDDGKKHDPIQDSIRPRQSRPYAYARPSSGNDMMGISPASSLPAGYPGGSSSTGQQPTSSASREGSPRMIKNAECSSAGTRPNSRKTTAETAGSDDDHRHHSVRPEYEGGQMTPQPTLPPVTMPQAGQRQRRKPQPRPMGISDMYWASEEGKAEQAFASGNCSISGAVHGFVSSGYAFCRDEYPSTGTTPAAGGSTSFSSFASSSAQHMPPARYSQPQPQPQPQPQIWEVDSDEAEEIEQGQARATRPRPGRLGLI